MRKHHCQADEYSPAIFTPPDDKAKAKLDQVDRWTPGGENDGTANTRWQCLCAKCDGEKGNNQYRGDNDNNGGKFRKGDVNNY